MKTILILLLVSLWIQSFASGGRMTTSRTQQTSTELPTGSTFRTPIRVLKGYKTTITTTKITTKVLTATSTRKRLPNPKTDPPIQQDFMFDTPVRCPDGTMMTDVGDCMEAFRTTVKPYVTLDENRHKTYHHVEKSKANANKTPVMKNQPEEILFRAPCQEGYRRFNNKGKCRAIY